MLEMIIMMKTITLIIHTVKVRIQKMIQTVKKSLKVQFRIIKKETTIKIITIMIKTLTISKFILIKMMIQILIKDGEDQKDQKIKRPL